MRALLPFLLVTPCACGRVAFEDVPAPSDGDVDALLAHDEDGDGQPDATDNCPFVASSTWLDSDGDGVGDVCDPAPTEASEQLVLFAPLTPDDQTFSPAAPWVRNADSLHFTSTGGALQQLILTRTLNAADVWMGVDIETCEAQNRQIAIVLRDTGNIPYHYAEMFDGTGSNPVLNLMFWNGSAFFNDDSKSMPSFPGLSVSLHFRVEPGDGVVAAGVPSVVAASKAVSPFTGSMFVQLGFLNCTGNVRYVAVITSS